MANDTKKPRSSSNKNKEPAKKYICIHGPNHGGTTLIGAMLGASPELNIHPHVGEAHAFFTASHARYGYVNCGNGDKVCERWKLLNKKPKNPYRHMFSKYETNTIIDSSKLPQWYDNAPKEFTRVDVLIWRCPKALRRSYRKRLNRVEAELRYAEDMARIFAFCKQRQGEFVAISLEYLTRHPKKSLKTLCRWTAIPYFEGKHEFWNYPNHHFGGSAMITRMLTGKIESKIRAQRPVDDMYDELGEWISEKATASLYNLDD